MAKKEDKKRKYSRETFLIHGNPYDEHWEYAHHIIPPITASTAFRLDSTQRGSEGFRKFNAPNAPGGGDKPIYIYDRLAEPTVALLENSMQEIEGAQSATAFASGMAAISGVLMSLCRNGSHVVAHRTIYGCTYSLMTQWLPRFGVEVDFVDLTVAGAAEKALRDDTRVIYLETPANPTLDVIDIRKIADLAALVNKSRPEDNRVMVVVDNTFATPFCQRPLELGADIVVHSLTKNVMGFGTDMGGMVLSPIELHPLIRLARKDFGGVVAPRAAWNILVYGITSLAVRMERQIATAMKVAAFLENRSEVARVVYPGLKSHPQHSLAIRQMKDFSGRFAPGTMIYFELAGEGHALIDRAQAFLDHLASQSYAFTLAVSLGVTKTLIEAPALMTHSAYGDDACGAGMSNSAMRLSIGLEDPEDLMADLDSAFKVVAG